MTETGTYVDMLGILGWASQIDAPVATMSHNIHSLVLVSPK
jgi:hypothetical protein